MLVLLCRQRNHPKVLSCLRDCSFLFRRALWLPGIPGFWFIVVLALNNAVLLLYLSDIKTTVGFGNISVRRFVLDNFMKGVNTLNVSF